MLLLRAHSLFQQLQIGVVNRLDVLRRRPDDLNIAGHAIERRFHHIARSKHRHPPDAASRKLLDHRIENIEQRQRRSRAQLPDTVVRRNRRYSRELRARSLQSENEAQ